MNQNDIIQSLRAEITKLQRVLDLLLEEATETDPVRRPGRPKGSSNKATSFNPEEFAPTKRTMSPEERARIAAAQKKRWAAQKAAPTKRPSKTVLSKSSDKIAPIAGKKSASAGKRTGSTQTASAKRPTVTATKSAGKKAVANKTGRPQQSGPPRMP